MNTMPLTLLTCPDGVLYVLLWHAGETNKPRCWQGFCLWFANHQKPSKTPRGCWSRAQNLTSQSRCDSDDKICGEHSVWSISTSDRRETIHSFLFLSSRWINIASNIVVNVGAPTRPSRLWRAWFCALLRNQTVFQKANSGCKGEGQRCGKTRVWDDISIFIDRHKPNETNRITLMWFEGHI